MFYASGTLYHYYKIRYKNNVLVQGIKSKDLHKVEIIIRSRCSDRGSLQKGVPPKTVLKNFWKFPKENG